METINLSYPLEQQKKCGAVAMAIGYFDGVHLGHQAVIERAKHLAKELKAIPAVMTFHPHPREVLGKANITRYLTPLPEKLTQLANLGVELVYVMKFDPLFAQLSKEEFVKRVLVPLGVKGIATGFNFKFGKNATGNAHDLKVLGEGLFTAEVVEPIQTYGETVSSSRIREELAKARMEEVTRILGRPYILEGKVVQGDQRGRTMGFPTANLLLEQPFMTPRRGVYVVKAQLDDEEVAGIMNIGIRPTFHDPTPHEQLEVHLFNREVDLYGKTLRIQILHYLREEQKFPSVDVLIKQIEMDKSQALTWLATFIE